MLWSRRDATLSLSVSMHPSLPLLLGMLLAVGTASATSVETNAAHGDAFLANGPRASRKHMQRYYPELQHGDSWTEFDLKNYLQSHWHPGDPLGTSCERLVRLGAHGEGGKTACSPLAVTASAPCFVVSVGSNGESSFEDSVLALNQSCEVDTIDPNKLPTPTTQSHNVFRERFTDKFAMRPRYVNRTISLLKIDCDGCEFEGLLPWLAATCTEQVLIEVHGCLPTHAPPLTRLMRVHKLLSALEPEYATRAL